MQILGDFTTTVRRALSEIEPDFESLPGLVVAGSHSPQNHDIENIIGHIREARENGVPALLICFGHQLGAIEHARNVLGIRDATSEEFGQGTCVVKKRPCLKVGLHEGETWWSNYEIVIDYRPPAHFVSVAYHPEYQSTKDHPHRDLVNFISICKSA